MGSGRGKGRSARCASSAHPFRNHPGEAWRRAAANDAAIQVWRRRKDWIGPAVDVVDLAGGHSRNHSLRACEPRRQWRAKRRGAHSGAQCRVRARAGPRDAPARDPAGARVCAEIRPRRNGRSLAAGKPARPALAPAATGLQVSAPRFAVCASGGSFCGSDVGAHAYFTTLSVTSTFITCPFGGSVAVKLCRLRHSFLSAFRKRSPSPYTTERLEGSGSWTTMGFGTEQRWCAPVSKRERLGVSRGTAGRSMRADLALGPLGRGQLRLCIRAGYAVAWL